MCIVRMGEGDVNEEVLFIGLAIVAFAAVIWFWFWTGRKTRSRAQSTAPAAEPQRADAAPTQTAAASAPQDDSDARAALAEHHRVRWETDPATFVPTSDAWAMAVAAPYALCSGSAWHLVRNDDPNAARNLLSQAWGVSSREDLLETMHSLLRQGHRTPFAREITAAATDAPAMADGVETRLAVQAPTSTEAAERLWRYRRARANDRGIRTIDLTAYDLIRFAMLARQGATVGFLSDAEAVDAILMVAPELRSRYDSWEALGTAFHTTRWFWNSEGGAGERELLLHDESRQHALLAPDGPWAAVPWTQPVDPSRMLFVDALLEADLLWPMEDEYREFAAEWDIVFDDELRRRGITA